MNNGNVCSASGDDGDQDDSEVEVLRDEYMKNINSKYIFLFLLTISNFLFSFIYIVHLSLPLNKYVINWRTYPYFFSYNLEFMKRGLIGTIFDLLNLAPTQRSIFLLALFLSNFTFFLVYKYFRKMFGRSQYASVLLLFFLFFFTVSPATFWNFGHQAGRADLFNFVIELLMIFIIIEEKRNFYLFLPIFFSVGILIHEAFIFMGIPVVLAFLVNALVKKTISRSIFIYSIISILLTSIVIIIYGRISHANLELLYMRMYNEPFPGKLKTFQFFMVITTSLSTNISITLGRYLTLSMWKNMFLALPFVLAHIHIYIKTINFRSLSVINKLFYVSPFLIFPMFILGIDFYRWFSMMLINMYIIMAYFIYINIIKIRSLNTESIRIALYIIFFYTFLGPFSASRAFDYVNAILY